MTMGPDLSRRVMLGAGCAALAMGRKAAMASAPSPLAAPMRSADFLDTLGVNTHLSQIASQYNDVAAVISSLTFCGLRHVRDLAINPHAANGAHYEALAAAGAAFCLCLYPHQPIVEALARIGAFEAAHPGAVHALEGPNEITPAFAFGGATGLAAGRAFMAQLRRLVAGDPRLSRTPLVEFTAYARVASDCDFANVHPYPKAGDQPGAHIRRTVQQWVGPAGVMPGKPIMFTEFGYHTLPAPARGPADWQGLDEDSQACVLINAWLDAAAAGVSRVYLYQLLDGDPDRPALPRLQHHFGLFRFDGAPKTAARAIRSMTTLLSDTAPSARGFALRPLRATITLDEGLSCLPLQNSQGRTFLMLWNESPIWDPRTASPRPIAPGIASLTLAEPAAMKTWGSLQLNQSTDERTSRTMRIAVGAHPVVLQIG